ncbi:uncharacterized protein LOC131256182 [Magnolia sinica]|uniref:uncharacterized protein LOC131256182 n=1 Tax=Magnolia sinica TaxID=86752 RepID=UPI002658AF19|nr:uncharacterized protein LOC131256182 [Magnolia sinica]
MTPFTFSIKLAAVASRKEHINLEQWLNENLSTYKDTFFEDCLKFLKEIPSAATNDASANPFQHSSSVMNLYLETSSTLLKVLQAHSGQLISHQLSEELRRLQASSVHANPRLQNGGGHVSEGVKPKGRGASKKAPARKKMPTAVDSEEEDDKVLKLKEQLATYNINSPSDQTGI